MNKLLPKKKQCSVVKIKAQNKDRVLEDLFHPKKDQEKSEWTLAKSQESVLDKFSERYPTLTKTGSEIANITDRKKQSSSSVESVILASKNTLELEASRKMSNQANCEPQSQLASLEKYGIIRSFKKRGEVSASAEKPAEMLSNSIRYSTDNFGRLKTELDDIL